MDAALVCIAQSLLEGVDAGGSRAPCGSVDAAELLGDLAVDSKHCLALLRFTLRSLGLSSGVAPKSKHVRHCCALILARLLTEAPASRGHSLELAFVQLALDKFAPIRLVALPGLAVLGTAQTLATLVEMVCSDPVAKIRQEALMQVEMLQAKLPNKELAFRLDLMFGVATSNLETGPDVLSFSLGIVFFIRVGSRCVYL